MTKSLYNLSPKLQIMQIHLAQYAHSICQPEKKLKFAYVLSRGSLCQACEEF